MIFVLSSKLVGYYLACLLEWGLAMLVEVVYLNRFLRIYPYFHLLQKRLDFQGISSTVGTFVRDPVITSCSGHEDITVHLEMALDLANVKYNLDNFCREQCHFVFFSYYITSIRASFFYICWLMARPLGNTEMGLAYLEDLMLKCGHKIRDDAERWGLIRDAVEHLQINIELSMKVDFFADNLERRVAGNLDYAVKHCYANRNLFRKAMSWFDDALLRTAKALKMPLPDQVIIITDEFPEKELSKGQEVASTFLADIVPSDKNNRLTKKTEYFWLTEKEFCLSYWGVWGIDPDREIV